MTKEQYEKMVYLRTRINLKLKETNFQDNELLKQSLELNKIIESYEIQKMSEADKRAYDIRHLLNSITKKLEEVNHEAI